MTALAATFPHGPVPAPQALDVTTLTIMRILPREVDPVVFNMTQARTLKGLFDGVVRGCTWLCGRVWGQLVQQWVAPKSPQCSTSACG